MSALTFACVDTAHTHECAPTMDDCHWTELALLDVKRSQREIGFLPQTSFFNIYILILYFMNKSCQALSFVKCTLKSEIGFLIESYIEHEIVNR